MAEVIRMPKLSDTMEEGVVAEWHKKVGDKVEAGELLAEIETDKATMEFESFYGGVLLHIGVEKGKGAPVNDILAIIGNKDEDIKSILASEALKEKDVPKEDKPVEERIEKEVASTPKIEEIKTIQSVTVPTVSTNSFTSNSEKIKASPLARKLAKEKSINLSFISGSGDGGRIIKRDVENYSGGNTTFVGKESYTDISVSQMRKTIAKRLGESKFTAPHFYLTMSINMDQVVLARNGINASISPAKVSFNDFIIKAVAAALKKNPQVNASWLGDKIRYNNHVHIGVAVAVEEGLLVPVIRFADGKTLTQISTEVRDFAGKAKEKKLQPKDWEGNTFTISNLGMFGIEEFTAIINPPDACILAVGGINQTPVVKNGKIEVSNIMKVTLSCDHRVVDGAVGSRFLNTLKEYLETPLLFLGYQNI